MTELFAETIADLYADDDLTEAATYTPTVGAPVALRVVRNIAGDDYGQGFDAPQRRIREYLRVQVADVAQPVRGDTVAIEGGSTYVVRDVLPQNALEWRLEVNGQ